MSSTFIFRLTNSTHINFHTSVKSYLLCSQGKFNEEGFRDLFAEPAKYPGSSATRRIDHNITDIQGLLYLPYDCNPKQSDTYSVQPRSLPMSEV